MIGYYFYYTNSSGITDLSIEENEDYQIIFNNNEGILSFSYNGENFSFNLSDSNIGEDEPCYYIYTTSSDYIDRIIYNPNMNYFTLFGDTGSLDLNSSTPNQLIDYR